MLRPKKRELHKKNSPKLREYPKKNIHSIDGASKGRSTEGHTQVFKYNEPPWLLDSCGSQTSEIFPKSTNSATNIKIFH